MPVPRRIASFWAIALLVLSVAVGATPAVADALDDAKAAGQVGERYDGYLGVVKDSASARALVADINAKRKAYYAKIAAKNGATVEATAAIAGAKLVKGAPSGQYVMPSASSGWQRVP
jgi:uncharacterized protein YdbL (DUF1318 family)